MLDFPTLGCTRIFKDVCAIGRSVRLCEGDCIAPALVHVDTEPDGDGGRGTKREQKGETLPVVACNMVTSISCENFNRKNSHQFYL